MANMLQEAKVTSNIVALEKDMLYIIKRSHPDHTMRFKCLNIAFSTATKQGEKEVPRVGKLNILKATLMSQTRPKRSGSGGAGAGSTLAGPSGGTPQTPGREDRILKILNEILVFTEKEIVAVVRRDEKAFEETFVAALSEYLEWMSIYLGKIFDQIALLQKRTERMNMTGSQTIGRKSELNPAAKGNKTMTMGRNSTVRPRLLTVSDVINSKDFQDILASVDDIEEILSTLSGWVYNPKAKDGQSTGSPAPTPRPGENDSPNDSPRIKKRVSHWFFTVKGEALISEEMFDALLEHYHIFEFIMKVRSLQKSIEEKTPFVFEGGFNTSGGATTLT